MSWTRWTVGLLALGMWSLTIHAADPKPPTQEQYRAVIDKAVAFLKQSQNADGSWSAEPNSRGITGIAVTGLLRTGLAPTDAPAAKGLDYIEKLVNPAEGHIAGDSKIGIQNYVTSINVLALTAAGREDKYKAVVKNASEYLKRVQWDDSEGAGPNDVRFGGAGYGGGGSRPDLSNTAFFLEALKAAGVPQDDPAFKKAVVFISRTQHLKSEYNDQPWAGTFNNGSFIYTPANGGETRTDTEELLGYGSMTYAGVKSMIYCGLTKEDPRVKAALGWIRKNYTLDANPGMPPQLSERGLYYYYNTFGKTMEVLGEDKFQDAQGVAHDWRADLFHALASRQNADGSWQNKNDRWLEGDKNLVTGYALMALSYCQPK